MSEQFDLNIAGHSATLKIEPTGSKDTGIFFPPELIDFLGGMENLSFIIYKDDCIAAMASIIASLPLYSNKGGEKISHDSPSEVCSSYMKMINEFFGQNKTTIYKDFKPSETTQSRRYLYGLDKGNFSIRKFLIANYSTLSFLKDDKNQFHLRIKTNVVQFKQNPLPEGNAAIDIDDVRVNFQAPQNQLIKQKIIFGAPGTGKSHQLEEYCKTYFCDSEISNSAEEIGKRYERATFYPNYSFAQFVGTYKPVQNTEKGKESEILYKYIPGPFLRILVKALQNPEQNFLLIIEEINRANVAAVFGDVFQLLDRKNGVSEYPIAASEDIKKYLKDNGIDHCDELRIPNNMYIWATMNSADQGVFPMDTAFKRRWEFEYIGINEKEDDMKNYEIPMQKKEESSREWMNWNELRHKINDRLTDLKINEDKLLGPYFISEEKLKLVEGRKVENAEEFVKFFKSKVLMYLFEDAVKMRPRDLFDENTISRLRFSDICEKFDEIGQRIFNFTK
ncbi:AAA domain (dynein-related subfamily) [Fibrobacter sp. UWB16]|uniref:AAA family ATPase n=1 Tax=unclassified Fibrobacter TaxID=2634177 RepID=UPI000B520D55|nr:MULTISPECIES: AAA family ATPase [unclassified Fibrobacter]OWV17554.1 hypothetical protein B7991_12010 [Fibrobacter sp. UWB3]SOD13039.1 AAA domain (dynein-related subfamily) [Fibrobacter sp. UWB16]